MKRTALAAALFCAAVAFGCPAYADGPIQMLPPTPLGSTSACPAGFQQILSYSGTPANGPQGGINCVPIQTDAAGDLAASGYIKPGNSTAACTADTMGAMRFNPATLAFEGCNGSSWQSVGGGLTIVTGGCLTYWAGCPAGYTATSYFSPGTYNCCDKCGKSNLEGKLDRLTDLLVDGHINEDTYKQKHKELAKRILDITDEAKGNTEGNLKFKEALSNIVCLLSNSRNLFESSHVEEKRKLLGFVFENLELEGATLRFSLRKPFELLADLPNNPEWRPLIATVRTHHRNDVLNLHKNLPP